MSDQFISYADYKKLELALEDAQAEIASLKHESERATEKYLNLLEAAGDSIFLVDLNTFQILETNSHAARRLGYTIEEIRDMSLNDIEIVDESSVIKDSIWEWESTYSGTQVYESQYRHRDGTLIPVEVSSRVVNIDGNVVIQNFVRNIQARKTAQQIELELALEHERVNLLSAFIENVAHEFRTPLSIIGTRLYLMTLSDNAEQQETFKSIVQQQMDRINNLVDILLLRAKVEATSPTSFVPVDITHMIRPITDKMIAKYNHNIQLSLNITHSASVVYGHTEYLAEALQQILDNAFQFTPDGGTITVSAQVIAGIMQIDVQDGGIGIAEDDLPHIFKAFWRHDKAHTTGGLGLGLSIAKQIIDQHQGEIIVDSTMGIGTLIRVLLPVSND